MQRGVLVGCVIFAACGPGTGGSSGDSSGGSTSAAGSTSTTSMTSSSSMTGSSTSGMPTSSGDGTTSAGTTSAGTTSAETTSAETTEVGTTGAALCEAIVGSRDCAAIVEVSGDLTLEECVLCQGAACGQEASCDSQYPCVGEEVVVQGCCSDADCAGLTPFCGMFIGTDNVCVLNDDV